MGPIMEAITIDAPRERVFEAVADLARRPSFCDHFQESFRLQRIDSAGVGAAARFYLGATLFPFWMETVIATVEAPHMIVESGQGGRIDRMDVGTAWELIETGGSMTDLRVTFWTEPSHPVDKLKDSLAPAGWHRRKWNHALERLQFQIESGAPIERLHVAGSSQL